MHRPRKVFQQKLDRQNIEHHIEGAAEPVMRIARDARRVADGHFSDSRAIKACQRRNEAMQFTVQIDFLEYFSTISLESCAEISKLNARCLRHQPVRDT